MDITRIITIAVSGGDAPMLLKRGLGDGGHIDDPQGEFDFGKLYDRVQEMFTQQVPRPTYKATYQKFDDGFVVTVVLRDELFDWRMFEHNVELIDRWNLDVVALSTHVPGGNGAVIHNGTFSDGPVYRLVDVERAIQAAKAAEEVLK